MWKLTGNLGVSSPCSSGPLQVCTGIALPLHDCTVSQLRKRQYKSHCHKIKPPKTCIKIFPFQFNRFLANAGLLKMPSTQCRNMEGDSHYNYTANLCTALFLWLHCLNVSTYVYLSLATRGEQSVTTLVTPPENPVMATSCKLKLIILGQISDICVSVWTQESN